MIASPGATHVSKKRPLEEFPTPQFRRDGYLPLNGPWEFEITKSEDFPAAFRKSILVPFAVETELSGIGQRVCKDDVLHYRRAISVPPSFNRGRMFLHFQAVDQVADVYLNGLKIGHHEGGYLPFVIELTSMHRDENIIDVVVKDDTDSPIYPRGKQKDKRGGIWYTPTSGIWQSVWLESTPVERIRDFKITPDFQQKTVRFQLEFEGKIRSGRAYISCNGKAVTDVAIDENGYAEASLTNYFRPWSPDSPTLYDVRFEVNNDLVYSYFAMREFGKIDLMGHNVFALNGKPLFLSGVLDQGYWPESGLTPPTDESILADLNLLKSMGFNMVRKHIKIEPMRWYYHCDRLGLIVMQDLVNGGAPYKNFLIYTAPFISYRFNDEKKGTIKTLGREKEASRRFFLSELEGTVQALYNVPSIAIWTIFNEGWGQFQTKEALKRLKGIDATRLVDANSGWYDQKVGDFNSRHLYFQKLKVMRRKLDDRILSLSEFGGYSLQFQGHVFSKKAFGYKKFEGQKELNTAISKLYLEQVVPLLKDGLSISVYTQLSDVEDEINGLVTYDRKIQKVDVAVMQKIHRSLHF